MYPFVITSVPDRRLGQAVTLLIEGRLHLTAIEGRIQAVLEPYYRPKYIRMVNHIPRTENGKINRAECRIFGTELTSRGKGRIRVKVDNLSIHFCKKFHVLCLYRLMDFTLRFISSAISACVLAFEETFVKTVR